MSEVLPAIEKANLWLNDVECRRLHYATTLRHRYDRFQANSEEAAIIYDDRFVRMWRFYLVASEQTFRYGRQTVFQFQISCRQDAVPLTRDYLYEGEQSTQPRRLQNSTSGRSIWYHLQLFLGHPMRSCSGLLPPQANTGIDETTGRGKKVRHAACPANENRGGNQGNVPVAFGS
jgi:hypothetical protein